MKFLTNNKIYLFDLDSTLTQEEILPKISRIIGKESEMRDLTEKTMLGQLPFQESFIARVKILQNIPVSEVASYIREISLNQELVDFIRDHKKNSYVVTSNLDVWIEQLMQKIGVDKKHYFCSHAVVEDDKIIKVQKVILKEDIIKQFTNQATTIAVGDGNNDRDMIKNASIGIGYGGVRDIAPTLFEVCDYCIYSPKKLYELLNQIDRGTSND